MENPTTYTRQGQGFSGRFDCRKYTCFTLHYQAYFLVITYLMPVLPGVLAVCWEVVA